MAAGWGFLLTKETEIMTVETQVRRESLVRSRLISLLHHIWPAAGLGVAVIASGLVGLSRIPAFPTDILGRQAQCFVPNIA